MKKIRVTYTDSSMREKDIEVPAEEAWLYKPENKEILEHIREGLKQKATINRGSFAHYLNEE